MTPEDEAECRRVVLDYAISMNEWEIKRYTLDRLESGRMVAPGREALVAGLTDNDLVEQHKAIFARCIVPRERKHGANPGRASHWGKDGSFYGVAPEGVAAVVERNRTTIEVSTQWSHMLPGGRTLFVLKRIDGRWLIDGMKTQGTETEWENALL